jgi:hypothetical protein
VTSLDLPPRKRSNSVSTAAVVVGAIGALAAVGALQRELTGAARNATSAAVWRDALGSWLLVGIIVDIARGGLLVAAGVGARSRASWAAAAINIYAGVTAARVLVGFYLIDDSLEPVLRRLGAEGRDGQILAAYVGGEQTVAMLLGLASAVIAIGFAWAMQRQPPPD